MFEHLGPGDRFVRLFGQTVKMPMEVISVEGNVIHARAVGGPDGYRFDRDSGAEIDEELGWGPEFRVTGSVIVGQ